MVYTVKQLAKASGVSIRALRYYDEVGLLKPSFYGDNGYRYYNEDEFIVLQQIIFYKELGFTLSDIKSALSDPDFDLLHALDSHRRRLESEIRKSQSLVETIKKALAHINDEESVVMKQMFQGFSLSKPAVSEVNPVRSLTGHRKTMRVREKINQCTEEEWAAYAEDMDELRSQMVQAIESGLSPDSSIVQSLVQKHYDLTRKFWSPTRENYIRLGELYASHPNFISFYYQIHPDLLAFLTKAMTIYANERL